MLTWPMMFDIDGFGEFGEFGEHNFAYFRNLNIYIYHVCRTIQ